MSKKQRRASSSPLPASSDGIVAIKTTTKNAPQTSPFFLPMPINDGFSSSHTAITACHPMEQQLLNKGGRIGIYLPEER
eukprot:CAMPEP_0202026684 /NCGR_PEP_ID=MMETSP0905-20130828/59560_1 /ASSEMBLY_ACC=CAM_ASM_000554 /TAXON_ID=420261 /ORGANISM="Thalassiosira antarctica, Strain CCMP982" /LENGTH=78 /DNA_ID=CAMNT_0048589965 /DNA_START=59 /DNA_END=292 /DNA_ORIENTATION=+